jgi:hypothetical protein
MSSRRLSLLLIAPALLAASTVHAQTPPPGATDQPAAAPASPPPAQAPADASPEKPASPPVEAPAPKPAPSWFTKPQFNITAGEGKAQWKLQVYGFAEFDIMNDSTRSFNDGMNSNIVARATFSGSIRHPTTPRTRVPSLPPPRQDSSTTRPGAFATRS